MVIILCIEIHLAIGICVIVKLYTCITYITFTFIY